MNTHFFIILFSILALLIVGLTLVFFIFRSLQQEVMDEWNGIILKLHDRLDKIPLIVEMIRKFDGSKVSFLQEVVEFRSFLWPQNRPTKERVYQELNMSDKVHQLWDICQKNSELSRDTNFLSIKAAFQLQGQVIESLTEKYNEKVRRYNHLTQFLPLRPFSFLLGFRRFFIFEFEV